ncbi:MAG: glutamate racemase [Flavobacteriales bacterium]|nr:glutamate racemase [Flavobacteriales bacterium]
MAGERTYQPHDPIGIFDSGLGGLSICREIVQLLPNESIIYLADSRNAPYGERSKEEIIALSVKNTELLIASGCKIVVVACNTATTNAIRHLRSHYDIPFIGIEPAIKPAALHSKTNKIGVLATKGTLSSELFAITSRQYRDEIEIVEVEGKGLVTLIESGQLEATKPLLEEYLGRMEAKGVDKIVLGCSHYPFLIPIIREIIPDSIQVIDSGEAVARQTKNVLIERHILHTSDHHPRRSFFTNGDEKILAGFLQQIHLEGQQIAFRSF